MKKLILCLAMMAFCSTTLLALQPVDALKARSAELLLQPKTKGTIPQLIMGVEFLFGNVEHTAHWAAREAHQGRTPDLAKLEAEVARFNQVLEQVHQQVLYGIPER